MFKKKISKILKKFKSSPNKNGVYTVGDFILSCPPNYGNINFSEKFELYDKFLPVLVRHIDQEGSVIDIGANIGDTAFSMLPNCNNKIIGIEASDLFFDFFEKNVKNLLPDGGDRITSVKAFVGTRRISGKLSHMNWGTATLDMEDKDTSSAHIPLDEILDSKTKISLIKTDTDGFDFDVIESGKTILSTSEPILFWENEIKNDFQLQGYADLYNRLESIGYKYLFVFDNFGNILFEYCSYKVLKELNNYIYNLYINNRKKTLYYTDVLACTEKNIIYVENAINSYKSIYNIKR